MSGDFSFYEGDSMRSLEEDGEPGKAAKSFFNEEETTCVKREPRGATDQLDLNP